MCQLSAANFPSVVQILRVDHRQSELRVQPGFRVLNPSCALLLCFSCARQNDWTKKLYYNWSADLVPFKSAHTGPPSPCTHKPSSLGFSLVDCAFRCWHTAEPCSLLIGGPRVSDGGRAAYSHVLRLCQRHIGLTSTLAISGGSEGQASHDYMVMGLSETS